MIANEQDALLDRARSWEDSASGAGLLVFGHEKKLGPVSPSSVIESARASAIDRGWLNRSAFTNIELLDSPEQRLPSTDLRAQLQATLDGSYTLGDVSIRALS